VLETVFVAGLVVATAALDVVLEAVPETPVADVAGRGVFRVDRTATAISTTATSATMPATVIHFFDM
jgi:hypothetical protein